MQVQYTPILLSREYLVVSSNGCPEPEEKDGPARNQDLRKEGLQARSRLDTRATGGRTKRKECGAVASQ